MERQSQRKYKEESRGLSGESSGYNIRESSKDHQKDKPIFCGIRMDMNLAYFVWD